MHFKLWIINFLLVIFGLLLLLAGWYLMNGSLEMYPTPADHDQARVAAATLLTIFVLSEVILIVVRVKIKSNSLNKKQTT